MLKFDEERQKESVRHNLSSLYGVERAPCDTQLREILDPVNPGQLWPAYTALNSPQFGQQARSTLVELVLVHLPLGINGRKIDDRLVWDILCYASVKRISIESACLELADALSGNTTREHLDAALDPSRAGMRELEVQLNQTLRAQLPKQVLRGISRRRVENAADLVEIPYHLLCLVTSSARK